MQNGKPGPHMMKKTTTLLLLAAGLCASGTRAETMRPFKGIEIVHQKLTSPRLIDLHIVRIDLAAPGIKFQVTPSSDLGESRLTTTRTALADAKAKNPKARLAVNASFFSFSPKLGIYPPYCYLEGIAASEGRLYSNWEKVATPFPAFNISRDNVPSIIDREELMKTNHYFDMFKDEGNLEPWQIAGPIISDMMSTAPKIRDYDVSASFYNAVSGSHRLVRDGTNTFDTTSYPISDEPHPRTGIGYGNGRLIIIVADGRNPQHSIGVTCPELADFLIEQGATDAVNLDGGGSTTLAIADPVSRLVNVPVGGKGKPMTERPVGSSIIIYADDNN
jgi:exopolysaccharide biosynthesis protein